MIANSTKTINFNAVVVVDVKDGTGQPIMYMNGTIDENGKFNVTKSIQNFPLYFANKEEADKDFADFNSTVEKEAERMINE